VFLRVLAALQLNHLCESSLFASNSFETEEFTLVLACAATQEDRVASY